MFSVYFFYLLYTRRFVHLSSNRTIPETPLPACCEKKSVLFIAVVRRPNDRWNGGRHDHRPREPKRARLVRIRHGIHAHRNIL